MGGEKMTIFKREFRRNLKALFIWGAALGLLILLTLSVYSQMAEEQQKLMQLMDSYPESIKKMFGMDRLNMTTLIGFYGVEVYMMTTLFGSIYASMLASNILAKEEYEKTAEFLLSKPVTRSRIVTEKLLLVLINILILNGIITLFSLIGFQLVKDAEIEMGTFLLLVAGTICIHYAFAALSFLLSAVMRRSRTILSISLGLVLFSYFLHVMAGLSDDFVVIQYLSFFQYFDAADLVEEGFSILSIIMFAATALLAVGLSYGIYRKKDISV
jgi:ABC-2 type transport system permease protein